MTNRILRTIREDEAELETLFSRQESALPLEGGRFANQTPIRTIVGGASYPTLPATPLTSQAPDFGFHPDRDTIAPEDVYSDTFGQALSGAQSAQELPVSAPATEGDARLPTAASPSIFNHPNIKKIAKGFKAYVGQGMAREHLGDFDTLEQAYAAVQQAEQERL